MDLWQLNVFCKVIEYRSFSKAGRQIHLSQPTVSSHIKDLEAHFGCRLIDRLSKEALPTKAGELLYTYACRLLAIKDEAESALAQFQGAIKGTLVIGGSTIPGVYILPRLMGAFNKAYPGVTVSLSVGDTQKIIDDVLANKLEMGIVGAETKDKRIVQERLIEDQMGLVLNEDHGWAAKKRVKLSALRQEPFIVREKGSGTRESIQQSLARCGSSLEEFNIVAEMGSTEAVIQGIKGRVGVSILSSIAVAGDVQAGILRSLEIEGLDLRRNFYLTRRRQRTASPLCEAFIAFIKTATADKKLGR
jgi:DNA-binding transcriptional LysR family regulator